MTDVSESKTASQAGPTLKKYKLGEGDSETFVIQVTGLPSAPVDASVSDSADAKVYEGITAKEFETLWSMRPEDRGYIHVMGKDVPLPRWQKVYGLPYKFSGQVHKAAPVDHPILMKYQGIVSKREGINYGNFIVNWYDGKEGSYMGAHSDDTRQLKPGSLIYSYNFTSDPAPSGDWLFRIRDKKTKEIVLDLTMPHNSLIVMSYKMQEFFTHEVPRLKRNTSQRVNITLRAFSEEVTRRLCQ